MYRIDRNWLYGAVFPHFARRGHDLLKDDKVFIEKCLSNIPPDRHRRLMRDYLKIWDESVAVDSSVEPRSFKARFEANTYIRNCCSNC